MMTTMKLRHELTFDATPDAVVAMLTDPAYWDKVAVATSAISSTATSESNGDTTTVVVDQLQKVVGVPGFAKKFVGDSTRAITTQVWTGSSASYVVETPGKPTSIKGTMSVSAKGPGSVLLYDLDVKASVPLIGGKLESLVAELFTDGLGKEQTAGAAWLAGDR
ncbi:MAG: Polyketide cyclase / dehydrase and lipid transport [Marmoricola sp.]|nr:Polyketide cyclase / dehydrase and lipid transport [Marmoricola sp.]